MLTEYIQAAMRHATFEPIEDSHHIWGEIPRCEGLYGVGTTEAECREDLESALEDWLASKIDHGDDDIPVFAGIALGSPAPARA